MTETVIVRVEDGAPLLTAAQAARWLRDAGKTGRAVSAATVLNWAKAGLLPCERAGRGRGGAYLFAMADLAAFEPPTPAGRPGRPRKKEEGDG